MHNFTNDYSEAAAPQIQAALSEACKGQFPGYTETDSYCASARKLIQRLCQAPDALVDFALGGTSANIIALNGLTREWQGVICAPTGHIYVHETGALAACGRSVLLTSDTDGFVSPEAAEKVFLEQTSCGRHMIYPEVVYISNTTELGGVWSKERFDALCDWADSRGVKVFMDGARLASALASPESAGLSLEHIAKRCAAFYLGGTKCGLFFGEAVVITDPELKKNWPYLIKERAGLMAKGWLLGAQFSAAMRSPEGDEVDTLSETLWYQLAANANTQACHLREGLIELGFEPYSNSSSNQQFFCMEPELAAAFEKNFATECFYVLADGRKVIRFVCSWATEKSHVDELLNFAKELC